MPPHPIERLDEPDGIGYRVPSIYPRSKALILLVMSVVFLGFMSVLFYFGAQNQIGGMVGIAFTGLAGSLLFMGGLWQLFGSITTSISGGGLRIRSTWLGFSIIRKVRAADIRGFEVKNRGEQGRQGRGNVLYGVEVQLGSNKTKTCSVGMNKQQAEWLLAELQKQLGT
jgi:hypothetical protein